MKFVDEEILSILDCMDDVRDRIFLCKAIGWDVSEAVGKLSGEVLDRFDKQFHDRPRLRNYDEETGSRDFQVEVGLECGYYLMRVTSPDGYFSSQVRFRHQFVALSFDLSTWSSP